MLWGAMLGLTMETGSVWVLLEEYSVGFFWRFSGYFYAWLDSGYMFCISIWLLTNFAQFLRRRGLGEVFFSVLTQNREGAQSMLRPSSCCAARTWILDIISTSIRG